MNIDEIEDNLNNHEPSLGKAIDAILNTVAKNQAILETLLELQMNEMTKNLPSEAFDEINQVINERIDVRLAEIQAEISSKFQGE
jgi:hypothetical protein